MRGYKASGDRDDGRKEKVHDRTDGDRPACHAKSPEIKQTDLCEKTGVSRSVLSAAEKGAGELSRDTFLTLPSLFCANEQSRKLTSVYDIALKERSAYPTASQQEHPDRFRIVPDP